MYNHKVRPNVQNDRDFSPLPKIKSRFDIFCTKLVTIAVISLTLRPKKGIFIRKAVDPHCVCFALFCRCLAGREV